MRTLFTFALVCLLAGSFATAQALGAELTRAEAMRLFVAAEWSSSEIKFMIPLYDKPIMESELQIRGHERMLEPWVSAGLVRIGSKYECEGCAAYPGVVVEITPKGMELLKRWCPELGGCVESSRPYFRDGRRDDVKFLEGPLGVQTVEITGITQPAPNRATVEFRTFLSKPNGFAKATGLGFTRSQSVDFVRYDDGWRIEWPTLRRR